MGTYYDAARLLFGRAGPNAALSGQQAADASVTYGTALTDSVGSAGAYSVSAHLDSSAAGTSVTLSVDAPVSKGDRLKVVTQGGRTSAVSLGTMARQQVADRDAAAKAKETIDKLKEQADKFKETADTIVYDRDLTDALEEFSRTLSATYTSAEQLNERLKEYSTTSQTSDAIKATVTSEYVKGLVEGEYETPDSVNEKLTRYSTTEQTADAITSAVSAEATKAADTYSTKTEVKQTAEDLTVKIEAKVDSQGAIDALSTIIKATTRGIEVGKVDENGEYTTPYGVMSSDGSFKIMSKDGLPMFNAASDRTCKREHRWSPMAPSDSSFIDEPTLALLGVELLMSSPGGVSSGTVKLNLGGYSASDYMFFEFVYTDGARSYSQRLYQPALNASTSLSRTVSDGESLYVASVSVKVGTGGITLSNNVQLYISPTGTTTSEGKLRLTKVLGWA
nr:MAG TPA: hypothetical protein [Caudoviricetes sp.]